MDQCMNCLSKGDLNKCMATDCTYHELWMVKALEEKFMNEIIEMATIIRSHQIGEE